MTTQASRRRRQATTAVSCAIPNANDLVLRHWVIAFIANRWLPRLPSDIVRDVRDKVGGQMRTAITKGKLKARGDGQFIFGDVIAWARTKSKWRGLFDDLPTVIEPITAGMVARGPRGMIVAGGYVIPMSLEECQTTLVAAMQRIRALERTCKALQDELRSEREKLVNERLDAERWRNFRKRSGRRGRM